MNGRFIAYYRVSTAKQGASGLGLDAQRAAVANYLNGGAWELLGEFTDVETGKHADRPELNKAMDLCRLTGARLLIAKLDRLSRNVHFLSGLMESGVDFVAVDMPKANKLTIHILAAVAEAEREAISRRTKEALGSVRERIDATGEYVARSGRIITRLGAPEPCGSPPSALGTAAVKAKADAFAARVAPTAVALRAGGMSLQGVADRLNAMRVQSPRGSIWTAMTVKRTLARVTA